MNGNKLQDVLGRSVNLGDLVLYASEKNEMKFGLAVSEKSLFIGERFWHYAENYYLVTNMDEKEQEIYNDLNLKYNNYMKERMKKKERQSKVVQKKYGIYKNNRGKYYLYLGKMKYSDEYVSYLNSQNLSRNKDFSGYAYLELSNSQVEAALKNGTIDILSCITMNNYDKSDNIRFRYSVYGDYYDIILQKAKKSGLDYIQQVNVKGYYVPGVIYPYKSLLNTNIINNNSVLEGCRRCSLIELE